MRKKINKALQSKALGKVLDSAYAKKVGIPLGNKIIKASRSPFVWMGKQIQKEIDMEKKKKAEHRAKVEAEIYRSGQFRRPN
jgi:hypothetical protein